MTQESFDGQNKIMQMTRLNLLQFNQYFKKKITVDQLARGKFQKLNELNLSNYQIKILPTFQMKNLKVFKCSGNGLENIEQFAQGNYPELQEVECFSNNLKSIPEFKMSKLRFIQFQLNKIQSIEQFAKGFYPQLQNIAINRNHLKSIPQFNAPKLKILNCCDNFIQTIHQFAKGQYSNLQQLHIAKNQLKSLPTLKTINIIIINCQNNKIQTVNQFAQGFYPYLQRIILSYNKLKNLCICELKVNKLTQFDSSFNQIVLLNQFHLNMSPYTHLPSTSLYYLQRLYLQQNHIKNIQGLSFINLSQLVQLNLNQNKIIDFKPLNKSNLSQLVFLYLQNNQDRDLNISRIKVINLVQINFQTIQKRRVQNIINVAKLQAKMIKNPLFGLQKKRISQDSAKKSLKRKFYFLESNIVKNY